MRADDVIGVFDLDKTSVSHLTRGYLACAQRGGRIVEATDELPKSFVVCAGASNDYSVYLSQVSPATILKRLNSIPEEYSI